jgi:MFS family permease
MRLPPTLRKLFAYDKKPVLLKYRSSKLFITSTVCFAIFTDIFLYGVVVPVIPFALTSRAHVPARDVQHWTAILLAVYGASLLVGSAICGWLADKSSSRRAALLTGLVVLLGATMMLCLGRSIGLLVAGRLIQGLSASVVWCVGLALLADTAGQNDAGQAMGFVSIAYTMGTLVAPLLGGVVYARAGYYAVFYMTFSVIAVDIILRLLLIEKKIAARWDPEMELQTMTRGKDSETKAPNESRGVETTRQESGNPVNTVSTTSTVLEKNRFPPIILLLKSRRILAAFWATFVTSTLLTAFDAVLPLYCNRIFGWNSLGGGLIFLALIIPSFSGPYIGQLCDKFGPRWPTAIGLAAALPFWVLLRLVDHDSLKQKVLLCALLMLIGTCVALIIPAVMAEFTYIVDAKEKQQPGIYGVNGAYAQAYGIFNVGWASGALVGPVWAGYVKAAGGWGTMTWSLGAFSAVSAIPVALFTGGFITRKKHQTSDREEGILA